MDATDRRALEELGLLPQFSLPKATLLEARISEFSDDDVRRVRAELVAMKVLADHELRKRGLSRAPCAAHIEFHSGCMPCFRVNDMDTGEGS